MFVIEMIGAVMFWKGSYGTEQFGQFSTRGQERDTTLAMEASDKTFVLRFSIT
jgi:hypothetical protein